MDLAWGSGHGREAKMIGRLMETFSQGNEAALHAQVLPMLDFGKLLLPLDLEEPSMPAVQQAAALAHHYGSEIVIVHAIRPLSYLGFHWDAAVDYVRRERQKIEATLAGEMDGLEVRSVLRKGDPARIIVETAMEEKVGAIVVGPHAYTGMAGRLLGSVTEKILSAAHCPVWACGHLEKKPVLPLRSVVCGVNFTAHDITTVRWAAAMAAEFKASLTLAHVTPGVEIYGPGGYHEIPTLKNALVNAAMQRMHKLQEQAGVMAATFIGSGDVGKVLSEAARGHGADLLVIGRRAAPGTVGGHCYSIITKSNIPVLAV